MLLQAPIPAGAIRDTISRIVLERSYRRSVSSTLLARGWEWFTDLLGRLFSHAAGSRGTYVLSIVLLAAVALATVARVVIVNRARRHAARQQERPVTADDQLASARSLAAQGAYVEAAHLLHAAIVSRLVEQRRVRRHPSKTVGDYGRDLRRSGDALTAPYTAFATVYDVVVYGDGRCDAARFTRLEQLAAPLVSPAMGATAHAA